MQGGKGTDWAGRRLHFVGIGGAGMSGLALVARALGAEVTGSDAAETSYLAELREAGIEPAIGHAAEHVPAGDDAELVYSSAVPEDNPERAEARRRGLHELHRGDLLGELTELRPTIAVAGTHGKTTTTSMIVHALRATGADPSYLIGGELRSTGRNAAWEAGEWLVVESDESDRSFLKLRPRVAVLTNVELDHHTTYATRADLDAAMREFLALAGEIVVWNRPELLALIVDAGETRVFDVLEPELEPGGVRFRWREQDVRLAVPGAHNALNAAAALEACVLAGADPAAVAAALADFQGAGRRFEHVGRTPAGAEVYDDYAHHPTEVRATIEAARTLRPRRVLAAFQPHLYSRTAMLHREFGAALALADFVAVLDVYRARERAEDHPGVTGKLVADDAADQAGGRPVAWVPSQADAERVLRAEAGEGDLVLTLGAGDIDALGRALVAG
jgi:UDP-N-acetylmuramate--alanine ligase